MGDIKFDKASVGNVSSIADALSVTNTGTGNGVAGISDNNIGVTGNGGIAGVFGGSPTREGVRGQSTSGIGVRGDSENNSGVHGESINEDGVSSQGGRFGVSGSGGEAGVFGSSTKNGVHGKSTSQTDSGVLGENTGGGYGVSGSTESKIGAGVWGNNAGSGPGVKGTSPTAGVYGESIGHDGDGVRGQITNSFGAGLSGISTDDIGDGVSGQSSGSGIGVRGTSENGVGVLGNAFLSGGIGVSGQGGAGGIGVSGIAAGIGGAAGVFLGNVTVLGDLTVGGLIFNHDLFLTLREVGGKVDDCCGVSAGGGHGDNFLIDHPLDPANKLLSHAAVKSPDMKNVYDGVETLDAEGEAVVHLPAWFETLNDHFRYQLTPIGAPGPNLHIAHKIAHNSFKIAGGTPGMEVSWQVTGVRKDPRAEAHRLVVEQNKLAHERGYYVDPELYGRPNEQRLGWVRNPEWMRLLPKLQQMPETAARLVEEQENSEIVRRLKGGEQSQRGTRPTRQTGPSSETTQD
jgi:hypothetical protein